MCVSVRERERREREKKKEAQAFFCQERVTYTKLIQVFAVAVIVR